MAGGFGVPPLPPDAFVDQRSVGVVDEAPAFEPEPIAFAPVALDVPDVVPPDALAAGLAVPPEIVPEGLIEIEEPPAVEPEPALEFEPVPVGLGAVAEDVAGRIESAAGERERLEQRQADLRRVARDTRAAWAVATDPAEKQRLEEQFAQIQTAASETEEDLGTARAAEEETRSGELQRLDTERRRAERAAMFDARARFQEVQDKAAAAELERQERAATAEQELAQDRAEYRKALEAGPSSRENWVAQVVAMTGEVLMAGAQGRAPNFGPILDRLQNAAKSDWQASVQAKLDRVAEGKEGLDKIAAEQREIQAQTEAQKVAILEKVEAQLQEQLARAETALEKIQYHDAIEATKAERIQRTAQAIQTRENIIFDRRKVEADIALKEAQARKTGAEAGVAERKALGGGLGRPKPGPVGIDPALVSLARGDKREAERLNALAPRDPRNGRVLRQEDGTPFVAPTPEEAKTARATLSAAHELRETIDKLVSLRGKHKWEPTSKYWSTDAGNQMKSLAAQLLLTANKAASAGALDNGSLAVFADVFGGDPTGWKDPRAALLSARERSLSSVNATLRGTGFTGEYTHEAPRVAGTPDFETALEQASETYNPRSGRVGDPQERLDRVQVAFEAARGETGGEAELATDVIVERGGELLRDAQGTLTRMKRDLRKASEAGDATKIEGLRAGIDEQRTFIRGLDAKIVEWRKELAEAEKARGTAEEKKETRREEQFREFGMRR